MECRKLSFYVIQFLQFLRIFKQFLQQFLQFLFCPGNNQVYDIKTILCIAMRCCHIASGTWAMRSSSRSPHCHPAAPCYHSTAQAQGQHRKELAPLAAGTEPPAASRANPLLIMLAPQRHSSPVKRKQEKINECLCALHVCVYVWMHAYARIGQLSHCRKLRVLENVLEIRPPLRQKKVSTC